MQFLKFHSSRGRLAVGVVAAIIAVAIFASFFTRTPDRPAMDVNRHEAIGRGMAEHSMKVLEKSDRVVLVIPASSQHDLPAIDIQVEAFRRSLKQAGQIQVVAEEKVRVTSPRVDGVLTPQVYFGLVDAHPDIGAIICFAGAGAFSQDELRRVTPKMPRLHIVSMSSGLDQSLLSSGLVRLAIVPRFETVDQSVAASQFDIQYQVIVGNR